MTAEYLYEEPLKQRLSNDLWAMMKLGLKNL